MKETIVVIKPGGDNGTGFFAFNNINDTEAKEITIEEAREYRVALDNGHLEELEVVFDGHTLLAGRRIIWLKSSNVKDTHDEKGS